MMSEEERLKSILLVKKRNCTSSQGGNPYFRKKTRKFPSGHPWTQPFAEKLVKTDR